MVALHPGCNALDETGPSAMEIRLDGPGILSLLRSFDRLCVFHEFQDVAALGTCIADGSGRKFKHGVRGKTPGNPPRRNTIPDFLYSMFPVEIDEIDRKPHEEGVDSFAGNDPQSLSFAEPLSAKKSLGTLGPVFLPPQACRRPACPWSDFEPTFDHRAGLFQDCPLHCSANSPSQIFSSLCARNSENCPRFVDSNQAG